METFERDISELDCLASLDSGDGVKSEPNDLEKASRNDADSFNVFIHNVYGQAESIP